MLTYLTKIKSPMYEPTCRTTQPSKLQVQQCLQLYAIVSLISLKKRSHRRVLFSTFHVKLLLAVTDNTCEQIHFKYNSYR